VPRAEQQDNLATRPEIAPDCAGLNFFDVDHSLRDLIPLYLGAEEQDVLTPHMQRLGALAGGRLDELARTADRHPPVLHARDRFGADEDYIEYHPAYREMEQIAFGRLGSVRGYRTYLTVTDDGFLASGELRVPVGRLRLPYLADSDTAGTVQIVPF